MFRFFYVQNQYVIKNIQETSKEVVHHQIIFIRHQFTRRFNFYLLSSHNNRYIKFNKYQNIILGISSWI